MRMRKLPNKELRRYVRDSRLLTAEVKALWRNFTLLDATSKGFLTPEVELQSSFPCLTKIIRARQLLDT